MLNLSSTLLMTTTEVVSLVSSGIFVGFVNTLAGGATIVSLTVLLMLGLPMSVANGTNRIPVIMQNIVAVGNFHRKGYVDWKKGIYYTIPSVIGALLGSFIVVQISERTVEICFGFLMILVFRVSVASMLCLNVSRPSARSSEVGKFRSQKKV